MNKKIIIITFLSFLSLSLLINGKVLAHKGRLITRDCTISHVTPTPTLFIIPTATPILSLAPTPTATASPTPIQVHCTENCGTPPVFAGSTTNPPALKTCNQSLQAPSGLLFTRISSSAVSLAWWPSTDGGGVQSIEYGVDKNDLKWGVIIPSDIGSQTISFLPENASIWAKVCLYKDSCSACTDTIDP